jgi:ribose transport system substrate-binding protein
MPTWANIYSIPTWMKGTTGTIEDMANELKKQGLVESLTGLTRAAPTVD